VANSSYIRVWIIALVIVGVRVFRVVLQFQVEQVRGNFFRRLLDNSWIGFRGIHFLRSIHQPLWRLVENFSDIANHGRHHLCIERAQRDTIHRVFQENTKADQYLKRS
jgi:hypothetical protein